MKYAIISTVSSDRFDYKLAADSAGQPRLAQLAIIYVDERGTEAGGTAQYVAPDGWRMSPEAAAETGVTDALLAEKGIPASTAAHLYLATLQEGYAVVAYGSMHHMKLMRGECRRANVGDRYETTLSIDIMRPLVDVCRIPNVGRKGYKFPKMVEALAHFRVDFPAVRDAVVNARLSLGLFRALVDLGRLPAPAVPGND